MGEICTIYCGGIILVLIGVTGFLPLTVKQAIISGFSLFGAYIIPQFFMAGLSPSIQQTLFNNSFFFISFILVTSVLSRENSKTRLRQFLLRNKIESLGSELTLRTKNLKATVKNRMKEIEESKIRYQFLYDNISDFVVLIDKNGTLLLANTRFKLAFRDVLEKNAKASFFDTVHTDDREVILDDIIKTLHNQCSVTNIEFRLKTDRQNSIDVECNTKRIGSDEDLIGYQLIMRDISVKKNMQHKLKQSQHQVAQARMATILGLAQLAEYRDQETGNHLEQIREYSRILAIELSIWPEYQERVTATYINCIYFASILHDIGKVGIPDSILLKQGKLDEEEFTIMKQHTQVGADVLEAVITKKTEKSFLNMGKDIAYSHHEKWDGSGYPLGLKKEEIPLSACIVALADMYDALTSKRCYKSAFSHEKAKGIIIEGKGKHFSPDIVTAFLNREQDFIQMRKDLLVQVQ